MNYSTKLKLFKLLRSFFKFFNFQIFYSKEINYLKNLKIENIIDVGVADGTDFLLINFPNAKYFFIEPNPNYYPTIENKLLKKYDGKIFKCAAGKKLDELDFFNEGVTSSFLQRNDFELKNKIKVKVNKLDDILQNENINEKTLLKIDTEGYELDVLKGSENILSKIKYCIVETRLQNINTYNPSQLISFLYDKMILKVYYVKEGIDFIDILFEKNKSY